MTPMAIAQMTCDEILEEAGAVTNALLTARSLAIKSCVALGHDDYGFSNIYI